MHAQSLIQNFSSKKKISNNTNAWILINTQNTKVKY
jgi:hypothetical protein